MSSIRHSEINTSEAKKRKAVAVWLMIGVFMIVGQVLLGGVTRLTGSGLSITEWKPILGAIPPLNEADWQDAFSKYQEIAQFKYLNSDFTLGDFKAIYFWEWLHREWGRLMGVVFAIGFVWFLVKKYFSREMILPLVVLFVLGGLQGAVGWIMVQSGLNETDLYVSHIRLAVHFIAALLLLCYVLWFALKLLIPEEKKMVHGGIRRLTLITIALLTVQLIYGAFMAGLKAAPVAPTWPTINGEWLVHNTDSYGNRQYIGLSWLTDHPLVVHWIHRTLAYVLFFGIIWLSVRIWRAAKSAGNKLVQKGAIWPALLVTLQVLLGIFTVLTAPQMTRNRFATFELFAEAHQLVAMFLLISLFFLVASSKVKSNR
jgi:cytochrome c oxidase assembly protein subunit 15